MSIKKQASIKCPKCGKEIKYTYWDSLNTDINPIEKQELISGTLFTLKCENCEYITNINYPILYHDMKHSTMIYYDVNSDNIKATTKEFEALFKANKSITKAIKGYNFRIVTSQNQLREKAVIFDCGFDDRIIEIMKLCYFMQFDKQITADIESLLFAPTDKENEFEFVFILKNNQIFSASFDRKTYDQLENDFKERIEKAPKSYIINEEWAVELLNKK